MTMREKKSLCENIIFWMFAQALDEIVLVCAQQPRSDDTHYPHDPQIKHFSESISHWGAPCRGDDWRDAMASSARSFASCGHHPSAHHRRKNSNFYYSFRSNGSRASEASTWKLYAMKNELKFFFTLLFFSPFSSTIFIWCCGFAATRWEHVKTYTQCCRVPSCFAFGRLGFSMNENDVCSAAMMCPGRKH